MTEVIQESKPSIPQEAHEKVTAEGSADKSDGDVKLEPAPTDSQPSPVSTSGVPEGHGELVLVTGSTGYLGCHIVQQLLQTGQFRVRATVRSLANESKVKPLVDICPESKRHLLELVEADLDKPDSWTSVVKGCELIVHVASPFPAVEPENGDELVKIAVEGTLGVLKAAQAAGTVRRVVLTSSVAAVIEGSNDKRKFSEDDWSDPAKCKAYSKSKTLAERAAWDFVKQLPDNEKFELVAINPGFIMGPALTSADATSFEVVKRLLNHDMPMLPRLQFQIVDVRDVATAHVHALTIPGIAGSRHLLTPHSPWIKDIAIILAKEFKKQGYNVPTMQAPYVFIWLRAQFDPSVKLILPMINQEYTIESKRMEDVLLVKPRELKDTVIDMANSLIEKDIVKKRVQRSLSRRLSLKRFKSKRYAKAEGATVAAGGEGASAVGLADKVEGAAEAPRAAEPGGLGVPEAIASVGSGAGNEGKEVVVVVECEKKAECSSGLCVTATVVPGDTPAVAVVPGDAPAAAAVPGDAPAAAVVPGDAPPAAAVSGDVDREKVAGAVDAADV